MRLLQVILQCQWWQAKPTLIPSGVRFHHLLPLNTFLDELHAHMNCYTLRVNTELCCTLSNNFQHTDVVSLQIFIIKGPQSQSVQTPQQLACCPCLSLTACSLLNKRALLIDIIALQYIGCLG